MRIKTTHPIIDTDKHETITIPAGIIFDAPEKKAHEWIEKNLAIEVPDETTEAVTPRKRRTKQ